MTRVQPGEEVAGTAPPVDGLGGVADRDELGVSLVLDHVRDARVGILGLVVQHHVEVESRVRQLPLLEVHVVGRLETPGRPTTCTSSCGSCRTRLSTSTWCCTTRPRMPTRASRTWSSTKLTPSSSRPATPPRPSTGGEVPATSSPGWTRVIVFA